MVRVALRVSLSPVRGLQRALRDPEYAFLRAERGRAELTTFDRAAWAAEGADPVYPMVASFAEANTGFPAIRFVLDPNRPAVEGTRKIR